MPQSLAAVYVHLVYSTKNRVPLLTPEIEGELYPYQNEVLKGLGCSPVLGNGTADHSHWLFRLGRTVSIAAVVEEVKTSSSKWIKTKGPAFAGFSWQAGYGAFSVSASMVPQVEHYIANQKQHHATMTFQDELRTLLRRYGIDFDERYVWD
ncbi:MAG: transposase [Gemmataceae bacterium]